jgi:putative transposase
VEAPSGAGSGGRAAGSRDRDDSRGEPAAVWVSPDPCRTDRPRLSHESQTGGPSDAQCGLAARRRRRFRVTTQSRHPFPIAPNVLARQFERSTPDQAWVTDITYIPTGEGWLYLAVILDLCSCFAVGWAMSERITDDLTLDALRMALARRRPPQGLLHHSDRGSQYASGDYQQVLAQHGIVCSMSRRGDCWDNAVAESFFATLKVELVHDATWETRTTARTELFDYIERFYNGQRRHSALGYLSPRGFELRHQQEALTT